MNLSEGGIAMFRRIGFSSCLDETAPKASPAAAAAGGKGEPVKSVVRVHFPARNMTLSYYNDLFDLKVGDIVFVEGKLEGLRGRVVDVTYNFKIKLSDYKRVISVADTEVRGEFFFAGSHFITFDPTVLPYAKFISWFKAPDQEDDLYVSGSDDSGFDLNDLSAMKISREIAERGHGYYMENRVRYICLDGTKGRAAVEGSQTYELEFEYQNGEIRNLTCSCFCSYPCKHEFAATLQLRETLELIAKHYEAPYKASNYFAAVAKGTLMSMVVDGKETGSMLLG